MFKGNHVRVGMNVSILTNGGRGGGRVGGIFGYGQGEVGRFGYGRGRGRICGRGGHGGSGGRGGACVGRGNHNSYNNNRRQNQNHGVDTSYLTRNFTPE